MDGHFTEDRAVWKNELQRHCDEVYGEAEMQKDRIMKFKTADANHVTEDWRVAGPGWHKKKVHAPEGSIFTEMIKGAPKESVRNFEVLAVQVHEAGKSTRYLVYRGVVCF